MRPGGVGNCIPLDQINIGASNSASVALNEGLPVRNEPWMEVEKEVEHDHCYVGNVRNLSEFSENITTYISGFVCRKISKQVKCEQCIDVLLQSIQQTSLYSLINLKDKGGLMML